MVINFHYCNYIPDFIELSNDKHPNDGYGNVMCMSCGTKFYYDIFDYDNIVVITNNSGVEELVYKCPICKKINKEYSKLK